MKPTVLSLLLLASFAPATFAQSVTIPANSMTFTLPGSATASTITAVGPTLTDSQGNKWGITSGAQVQINTQVLTNTANVVEIALVGESVWHLNKAGNWYEATAITGTAPSQTVTWGSATTTSPIPTGTVTVTGPSAPITLPVSGVGGGSGLPSGMTYSTTTGLSVTGPITSSGALTGTQLSLTSGPALPTCSSGIYVYQVNASTGVLSLICLPLTINP